MPSLERMRADLSVTTIAIDDGKAAYIATKGVGTTDVIEVFQNEPRYFVQESNGQQRYAMLGPNLLGRHLVVAIAPVEGTQWRLNSAYWLRAPRGKRLYEEGQS